MADSLYTGSVNVAWDGASPATPPAGSILRFDTGDDTMFGMDAEGTFVATFILEGTIDGIHWFTAQSFSVLDGTAASSTLTAPGRRLVSSTGLVALRARCSAFTSGTINLIFAGTPAGGGGSGGGGGGGGGAVTIADGADVAQGTTTDAGIITDIAGTVIGFLRGAIKQWITLLTRIPAALTGSGNLKVAVVESTASQAVTGTVTANAGTGTFPMQATAAAPGSVELSDGAAFYVGAKTGQLPAALGSTTAANSLPVTLSTDGQFVTSTGSLTETAPATDTASSGLNGRLQRVAQRITSLIGVFGLTNNNAAPGATNSGALSALANATAPTWTEGNQVLASVTLKGDQRVSAGGYTPAAPTATFTRGANTTAYTIGDEVGTASTAPTTVAVGRFNGGSGVVQGAQVVYSSYAAVVPQLVVLLFSATVTLAGDNAQLNLSDSDAALLIGVIPLTAAQSGQYSAGAPVAAGNTIFAGAPTAPIQFTCGASQTTIYACIITLNAWTPIANSETLALSLRVEGN